MATLDRMLLLIRLLNSRAVVSTKDIQTVCGVSSRTVYRYLNALSEADIPVYFNPQLRGYCLTRRNTGLPDDQRIDHNILIAFGLKLLSQNVNAEYKREIDDLLVRHCATQPLNPKALPQPSEYLNTNVGGTPDYSEVVNVVMINAAISCGRGIRLSTRSRRRKGSATIVRQPRWHFNKQWYVAPGNGSRSEIIRLSDIESVTLL